MRLANTTRFWLPLAFSAVLAASAVAQEHPNIQPNTVRQQLNAPAAAPAAAPSAPQSSAPAAAPFNGPAGNAKKSGKGAKGLAPKAPGNAAAAKAPADKPAEDKAPARRDPFDTLLTRARQGTGTPENLPPGKAGLIVDTLRIDGIVHSPNGMIAIVSNSQQRVYFLKEGDKLYDGSVDKIALDAISFHQVGKDAFGKPLEHIVTKRLYPSSGEQQ